MTIRQTSFVVIGSAVLLRIITFVLSANFDADSGSRSILSLYWSFHPFFIWHPTSEMSVWLPLQFYIDGLILLLWDNVRLVPRLISLVASLISLPLFFGLAGRLFDREKACVATACFALYALHIKFGNIAGSESLFILFVLAAIYAYHRFLERPGPLSAVLLGGTMLLAVMMRFEAWILPPFIFVAILVRIRGLGPLRQRRILMSAGVACLMPLIFMAAWMYGSFREYGDFLYSLKIASSEHANLTRESIGRLGSIKTLVYRALFWPGAMLISLSPFVFISGIWGMIKTFARRTGVEWIILFVLQLSVYLYQSLIVGDLAPLARFTILPGTLLCLFAARGLFSMSKRLGSGGCRKIIVQVILVLSLVWTVLLCPNYHEIENPYLKKLVSVSPVTTYPPSMEPVMEWMRVHLGPDQKVLFNSPTILSNVVIIYSGVPIKRIVAFNKYDSEAVEQKIIDTDPTYVICHRQSPLRQSVAEKELDVPIVFTSFGLHYIDSAGEYIIYAPYILRQGT